MKGALFIQEPKAPFLFNKGRMNLNISGLFECTSNVSCLTTQLITAIVIGTLLFLVASGLSFIFGVLRIGNFAHGSLYMVGAYLTYTVVTTFGSFWLALILAPIGVGFLGITLERLFIKRIYGAPHLYQFLLTFGLLLVLDDAVRLIWGFTFKSIQIPKIFQRPPIFFLGSPIPVYYFFIIGVGGVVSLGLWFIFSRTKFGKIINAAASDPDMLECLGINVRLVYSLVFAMGAMMAGFGGFLALPIRSATPGMGFSIIIESFIVVVIGGIGSIGGVLIASLLVGLLRSFGTIGFPDFELGFVFFLVTVVLVFRPWGIFGRPLE
jgi:branched-chain amino acid transport system permease protein